MDQIERAYEINPYSLHVSAYLGQNPFSLLEGVKPLRTAAIAFLKARPGTITAIKPPATLPESVHSFKIQAEVGAISEQPICWRAREGVVEYTWDQFFTSKSDLPLSITHSLSQSIFKVAPLQAKSTATFFKEEPTNQPKSKVNSENSSQPPILSKL